jgi:hypothetical protein
MIYIDGTLNKMDTGSIQKRYKEFQDTFLDNFSKEGRLIDPIVIKYKEGTITDDPHNRGKKLMPRSRPLSFVVNTIYNDRMCEIRYTRNLANIKDGKPVFMESGTSVVGGHLSIVDPDLAFFFWEFSKQNYSKPENMHLPTAYFEIENKAADRIAKAKRKQEDAMLRNRIWGDPSEGGTGATKLKEVAKHFMIPGVDKMAIEDIQEGIEVLVNTNHDNRDKFLNMTDKNNVSDDESAERKQIISNAIALGHLTCDILKRTYHLTDPKDKKPLAEPLFSFGKGERQKEAALYVFLEAKHPEILDQLKERAKDQLETA